MYDVIYRQPRRINLLQPIVKALEQRFVWEFYQQEVDESHGTEEQTLDQDRQPGFQGKNSDSSLFVEV